MANSDIVFKSGTELSALIKARQISPVEVVQAYLDRIQTLNPSINAFITVTGDGVSVSVRRSRLPVTTTDSRAVGSPGLGGGV